MFPFWPELVAHQAVHDEVCRGDEAEKDVRHEAEQVIPDGEALAQVTLLNTGPDGVDDDDIIHHDDDPGQAAEDEDDGDHDEDQGQPLLAFTEVTHMSPHVNNIHFQRLLTFKSSFWEWLQKNGWETNIFWKMKICFVWDISVPDNFLSKLDILGLDRLWELKIWMDIIICLQKVSY